MAKQMHIFAQIFEYEQTNEWHKIILKAVN